MVSINGAIADFRRQWLPEGGFVAKRLAQVIERWATRRRERLALAELDDRLLRDIGIDRLTARSRGRPALLGRRRAAAREMVVMARRLAFRTLDVFTDERFRGNPLAVVLDAGGLETAEMQAIAGEFNLSETVFVTFIDAAAARADIRIFTPRAELSFAGHPTVGTALLLARNGLGQRHEAGLDLVLAEGAGDVPVAIDLDGGHPARARFTAPGQSTIGTPVDAAPVAAALGLDAGDLTDIQPRSAGFGVLFLMVELASLDALARASLTMPPAALLDAGLDNGVYLFTRATPDGTVRARMFAPLHGIAEDPATGSAAAGLAVLLANADPASTLDGSWRIVQGVEMGRRSVIDVTAAKRDGAVGPVTVAGGAVAVSEGWIEA